MNSPDAVYLSALFNEETNIFYMSVESFIAVFLYHYCDLKTEIFFLGYKESIYPYAIHKDVLQGFKYQIWNSKNNHAQVRRK